MINLLKRITIGKRERGNGDKRSGAVAPLAWAARSVLGEWILENASNHRPGPEFTNNPLIMNDTNVTGRGSSLYRTKRLETGKRADPLDYLVTSEWLWEAAFWENSTLAGGGVGLNCVYTFTSIESMRAVHSPGIHWDC